MNCLCNFISRSYNRFHLIIINNKTNKQSNEIIISSDHKKLNNKVEIFKLKSIINTEINIKNSYLTKLTNIKMDINILENDDFNKYILNKNSLDYSNTNIELDNNDNNNNFTYEML